MRLDGAGTITLDSPVVTVRAVRRAAFIEFEYSLADGALAVDYNMEGPRNARPSVLPVPRGQKLRWPGGLRRVAIDDIDVVSRTSH